MSMRYPATPVEEERDVLAGVSFPDPYRWLERDSGEVRAWQREQAALASTHVAQWPHVERMRELVGKFETVRRVELPRYAAGQWFRTEVTSGAAQACALICDDPMGPGRVIFDPSIEDRKKPPFLSWISPSPDGRTLAVGVCTDGSERNTIRLVDVQSGKSLRGAPQQVLLDNWTGGVQWLPDSSGFFFNTLAPDTAEFDQAVYLHRRSSSPTTQLLSIPWRTPGAYRMVVVSPEGSYAVALEGINPVPVAIAPLNQPHLQWRPFITRLTDPIAGHVIGDKYIAITNVGADRGRLVAIPLNCSDPNDPGQWQELMAESDAVLRTMTSVGQLLYLTQLVDSYARVTIVNHDGAPLGEVPLPGRGAIGEAMNGISNLAPKGHPQRFLFSFSSLTASWGLYSHTPGQFELETVQAPGARLEDATVEDLCAVSQDGTPIPYRLVRPSGATADRHHPTLIHAYGGMNAPWVPQFPGAMAAFVAAGGVFVHAHLRGGGEFGVGWWRGGRFQNKQNSYDDLYAVAQDLLSRNWCSTNTLAVTGTSHGGLMAAVAATQRPDLWKVVVPRMPRIDLIGSCRTSYGRMSVKYELGDVDDPEVVRWLASISPYHLVRDGVRYPAIFVKAGDTDPRTHAWHARKFAARLQQASAGDAPILLHVWEGVGHGWANDRPTAVAMNTQWLAFTARHLGMFEAV